MFSQIKVLFVQVFFFFNRIQSIFNKHTHEEKGEGLKETNNGVYPKDSNS